MGCGKERERAKGRREKEWRGLTHRKILIAESVGAPEPFFLKAEDSVAREGCESAMERGEATAGVVFGKKDKKSVRDDALICKDDDSRSQVLNSTGSV